jgi:dienelactone hydrolase
VYLCGAGLVLLGGVLAVAAAYLGLFVYLRWKYLHLIVRLSQEKPLFVVRQGQPTPRGEAVSFASQDGSRLTGCYLRAEGSRRGVILFAVEFGANCWSCLPYCEYLIEAGFDVFAVEPRSPQGSAGQAGYESLPWVTDRDVRDLEAALSYLKDRPDADPRGVGLFGISKGASTAVLAAAGDPYVRCLVTDGLYATCSTMIYYMRFWFPVCCGSSLLRRCVPGWMHELLARAGLRLIERQRSCRFPRQEAALPHLAPRPLLMIHGGADNYIKPELAQALFHRTREPHELWVVKGAKHNQAVDRSPDEYRQRVLHFFEEHLAGGRSAAQPVLVREEIETVSA